MVSTFCSRQRRDHVADQRRLAVAARRDQEHLLALGGRGTRRRAPRRDRRTPRRSRLAVDERVLRSHYGIIRNDYRKYRNGLADLLPWRVRFAAGAGLRNGSAMAGLLEAIEIKRKMYFEFEDAPYHCLDVEVSKPTARGGQTLVPPEDAQPAHARGVRQDLQGRREVQGARSRHDPGHVPVQRRRRLPLHGPGELRDHDARRRHPRRRPAAARRQPVVQIQKFNGRPIGLQFPPIVELAVTPPNRACAATRPAAA